MAEEVFEEDAEGVGEAGEIGVGEGVEAEEADGGLAGGEASGAVERVGMCGHGVLRGSAWGAGSESDRARNEWPRALRARVGGKEKAIKNWGLVREGIRNGRDRGVRAGSASSSGWRDGEASGLSYAV